MERTIWIYWNLFIARVYVCLFYYTELASYCCCLFRINMKLPVRYHTCTQSHYNAVKVEVHWTINSPITSNNFRHSLADLGSAFSPTRDTLHASTTTVFHFIFSSNLVCFRWQEMLHASSLFLTNCFWRP